MSDAGNGGQVILTKDAADALIPRIHKVDALLESIGTFRIPMDKGKPVDVELLDCQPLPTPQHPKRTFSKYLRKIEYVAPGRSLAVIPPPPALAANKMALEVASNGGGYKGEEVFIVVIRAEEGIAEVGSSSRVVLSFPHTVNDPPRTLDTFSSLLSLSHRQLRLTVIEPRV